MEFCYSKLRGQKSRSIFAINLIFRNNYNRMVQLSVSNAAHLVAVIFQFNQLLMDSFYLLSTNRLFREQSVCIIHWRQQRHFELQEHNSVLRFRLVPLKDHFAHTHAQTYKHRHTRTHTCVYTHIHLQTHTD